MENDELKKRNDGGKMESEKKKIYKCESEKVAGPVLGREDGEVGGRWWRGWQESSSS